MKKNILNSKFVFEIIIVLAVVACGVGLAFGDPCYPPNCGWNFSIAPYAWMAGTNGNIQIGNFSSDFHIPFSQVLENFNGGAEVHIEAGYGPITLMFDPTFLKLKQDVGDDTNYFQGTMTSKEYLIDGGVFYQIAQNCFANGQYMTFELLGGGRYIGSDNDIDFDRGFSLSSNVEYLAPIVGARIKYQLSTQTHLWLRGDVGGFGVDNVNNTWSSTLGIGYNINPNFEIGAAYRVLKIDVDASHNSEVNAYLYGPEIGFSFNF